MNTYIIFPDRWVEVVRFDLNVIANPKIQIKQTVHELQYCLSAIRIIASLAMIWQGVRAGRAILFQAGLFNGTLSVPVLTLASCVFKYVIAHDIFQMCRQATSLVNNQTMGKIGNVVNEALKLFNSDQKLASSFNSNFLTLYTFLPKFWNPLIYKIEEKLKKLS